MHSLSCCARQGLTYIDEILVCQSGVIHVMDGGGKDGCHHFQRGEHSLKIRIKNRT